MELRVRAATKEMFLELGLFFALPLSIKKPGMGDATTAY
jgi:hypothetical protein